MCGERRRALHPQSPYGPNACTSCNGAGCASCNRGFVQHTHGHSSGNHSSTGGAPQNPLGYHTAGCCSRARYAGYGLHQYREGSSLYEPRDTADVVAYTTLAIATGGLSCAGLAIAKSRRDTRNRRNFEYMRRMENNSFGHREAWNKDADDEGSSFAGNRIDNSSSGDSGAASGSPPSYEAAVGKTERR